MSSLSVRVSDLATRIGTEFKTVKTHYSGNNQGTLTSLTTSEKSSLLAAINELVSVKETAANKGAANGYAGLDATGKVPSAQLPSFVDDVLEYANYAALPVTGTAGVIYVTIDDNLTYRWSGTVYVMISSSLALGETSSTAYRGDRGKTAYDHSQAVTGNPHAVTFAQLGSKPTTISGFGITDAYTKTETDTLLTGYSATSHTHSGVYEPAITKSTGYLKYTGSAWSFVNETYSLSSHDHSGVYATASHTHGGVYEPANANIQSHISATNIHIDWTNASSAFKTSGSITLDNSATTDGDAILTLKGQYSGYKRILFADQYSADRGRIQFGADSTTMEFWVATNSPLFLYSTGKVRLPEYGVGTFTGTKAYYPVLDASGYLIEQSSIPWADLSSKPTTISGYGITDAYTKTEIGTPDTNFVTVFETALT
jgi:hypothetical protein